MLAVAACAPAAGPAGGTSPAASGSRTAAGGPAQSDDSERSRYEAWEAIQSWTPVAGRFVSHGHAAGRYLAEVRVSPEARPRYRNLVAGTELPIGAVVAQLHWLRATGEPGPVFAMRKVDDDRWKFIRAEPDGTVDTDARTDLCARCHADGVSDNLFGIPEPAPESGAGKAQRADPSRSL